MLITLARVPDPAPLIANLSGSGITIRRAYVLEQSPILKFAAQFGGYWSEEIKVAFSREPVSLFIAEEAGRCVGFAAYECNKNYFGPTGVDESMRGKGIGKVLLYCCLHAMREMGYTYAIIGSAGPVDFYTKTCGAIVIPDGKPGFYAHPKLSL